jgi:hypothetical protein
MAGALIVGRTLFDDTPFTFVTDGLEYRRLARSRVLLMRPPSDSARATSCG